MKHLWSSLFVVIAIVCVTVVAIVRPGAPELLTPEEHRWLAEHEKDIVILGDPSYPPTNFVDSLGNQAGITIEIFRQIERHLNVSFRRVNAESWDHALETVKKERYTILGGISKTEERMKDLLFTQVYLRIPAVYVTANTFSGGTTYADLKKMRVAVPKSYAIEEYYKHHFPEIQLIHVMNDLEGLVKVSTGEVDVVLTDLPTSSYLIQKHQITNLRIAGETEYSVQLCFAVSKQDPILNSILIKALHKVPESTITAIVNRWITIDYNRFLYSKSFWITVILTAGTVLGLIALITLWNRTLLRMVQEKTAELLEYQNHLEEKVAEKTADLREKNAELQYALDHVQQLQGILPICASCKKIRDDNGYWTQVERYVSEHSEASFSHSVCPGCSKKLYGIDLEEETPL